MDPDDNSMHIFYPSYYPPAPPHPPPPPPQPLEFSIYDIMAGAGAVNVELEPLEAVETPLPSGASPAETLTSPMTSVGNEGSPNGGNGGDGAAAASQNGQNGNGQVKIAATACVPCRSKHLKCQGQVGVRCARCVSLDLECSWIKSRRGYRRRPGKTGGDPRNGARQVVVASSETPQPVERCPFSGAPLAPTPASQSAVALVDKEQPPQLSVLSSGSELAVVNAHNGTQNDVVPRAPLAAVKERCVEAYFFYFNAAHPFLPPKPYLLQLLRTRPLARLEAAIRYVGSNFVKDAPTEYIFTEAETLCLSKEVPRDAFTVQALLLLAIGLDGNCELKRASEVLVQAQDMALELGMQMREFAVLNGEGSSVMEECWRRTWWELYVIDGMIAGVHQSTSFRLNEIPSNVLLPCEEHEYISGDIPIPRSIEDFDDQSFSNDDISFSSFAYRIAALRIMGKILRLQQVTFADDPVIDQTDAHLVNWTFHLPDHKKLVVDASTGQIDEMLFQAQMVINACTILLHRPFSQLDTTVTRHMTSCAPHKPYPATGQVYNLHAARILTSANTITKLCTLPTPLVKHTHFFTCVVTLASIVHLSCWASLLPLSQDDDLKQRIRLCTGSLRQLGEVWPSAVRTGGQVRGVAGEVFAGRRALGEEGFWASQGFGEEEVLRSLVEDQGVLGEVLGGLGNLVQ